jgi:glycerol-3-phosphate dehydrogenase
MAEDCVDHAITLGKLPETDCVTKNLHIHGYMKDSAVLGNLDVYGSDAAGIHALINEVPELGAKLHPDLPYIAAEVVWGARKEMARTVEDVLARRMRALFLNANAAIAMAEPASKLLAAELGRDEEWAAAQAREFTDLAQQYRVV